MEPQAPAKQFQFTGTAGSFFVAYILYYLLSITIIGIPLGFNIFAKWVATNVQVNGKKLKYEAGYGEVAIFMLVNLLLTIVTLGIYMFWFVPKMYRFVADHVSFDDAAVAPVPAAATPAPEAPSEPIEPAAPLVQ